MTEEEIRLAATIPGERVLLISHCLRPSKSCPGRFERTGLACPPDCSEPCVVGRLVRRALSAGYKGVCVAAGGSMAVKYVAEVRPKAIVAVACDKELAEGVDAVKKVAAGDAPFPAIVAVPLSRDGCVDTEVDESLVIDALGLRNLEDRHSKGADSGRGAGFHQGGVCVG